MIRAILWDIDNTLLDFDVAEKAALTTDFKEFGLAEFTDAMLKDYMVINRRRWQALERGETICYRDDSYELVKSYKGKVLQCIASNGTKKAQPRTSP